MLKIRDLCDVQLKIWCIKYLYRNWNLLSFSKKIINRVIIFPEYKNHAEENRHEIDLRFIEENLYGDYWGALKSIVHDDISTLWNDMKGRI